MDDIIPRFSHPTHRRYPMPYLYEYDLSGSSCYNLLAAGEPGSFARPAAGGTIPADPSRRTILIGLGGLGVKTLDHIKSVLQGQYQPGWDARVGFLAADTDCHELEQTRHLAPAETILLTRPNPAALPYTDPATWSPAWSAIAAEAEISEAAMHMHCQGTFCRRLVGRLKLHDRLPGQPGFDEMIMRMLQDLAFNRLHPLPVLNQGYDVFVISSIYGGSGSGMFLDLPALIRRALGPLQVNIHAILYLPDDLPAPQTAYTANSYAALKELDYFQNLRTRDGYPEYFPCSSPVFPRLRLDSAEGLFQSVRLVSAAPHISSPSHARALDWVCRHILSGVEHDPGIFNPQLPMVLPFPLPCTEDGRLQFCRTVENVRAAPPQDILEACLIGRLCTRAGFLPVSESERIAMIAEGAALLPFRSIDQYDTVQQLDADAQQLLQPLRELVYTYLTPQFSYQALFGHCPTWEEIRSGSADAPAITHRTDCEIQRLTGPAEESWLRDEMLVRFRQFRQNAELYVAQHGPMAFVNLFRGNARREQDNDVPQGIEARLAKLDHAAAESMQYPDLALRDLQECMRAIAYAPDAPIYRMLHTTRRRQQAEDWVRCYDRWVSLRIMTIRLRRLAGRDGIVDRFFLKPARRMVQELYAFGTILEEMTRAYGCHGETMESYDAFIHAAADSGCVNLGALSGELYGQLRQWLDTAIQAQNPQAIRQSVIHDFFQDPDRWLEVDENRIVRTGCTLRLRDPRCPVAARRVFDECLRNLLSPIPAPTIADLFQMALNQGITLQDFAAMTVEALLRRIRPSAEAFCQGEPEWELVVPLTLHTAYPAITAALTAAAQQLLPQVRFRASHDCGSISLHQHCALFGLCHLRDLNIWQRDYEFHLQQAGNGLHSLSPDTRMTREPGDHFRYEQMTPWADYPGLISHRMPTPHFPARDRRTTEAATRLVAEARSAGVLYARQQHGLWTIRRVHLDTDTPWHFDPGLLEPDPETGLLPAGAALLHEILKQNRRDLSGCSHPVILTHPGPLSEPAADEETAWTRAAQVLWLHRPMLTEIRDTLQRIVPWFEMANG